MFVCVAVALISSVSLGLLHILWLFLVVLLLFLSISYEIGRDLQNDPFCVEWNIEP